MITVGTPARDAIQIVVILDDVTFVAETPYAALPRALGEFEDAWNITVADRTNQISQMRMRLAVYRALRGPEAEIRFREVMATACLWLSVRHWSNGEDIMTHITRLMEIDRSAVVTIAIDERHDAMTGTAWAIMAARHVHDERAALRRQPVDTVTLITEEDASPKDETVL